MRSLLIVIPCLNEAPHLARLLRQLGADRAAAEARIVVADGGSTDGGIAIVEDAARADSRIALLHNPKRLQSAGVNLAVARHGEGRELLLRVDAHAAYPDDFISRLIAARAESDADAVTVVMRAASPDGACFQAAAAAAQNSVLGAGGSAHRKAGARQWVDHGHHALFRLDAFSAVGGYDESFSHNEDAEFDTRLRAAGRRILLAGDIVIDYFPRRAPWPLLQQYFRHGRGRARTLFKHATRPKLRQALPTLIAPAALLALAAPLWPWAAAPAAAWLALSLGGGLILGLQRRSACAALSGAAAALMHLGWSAGFWRTVLAEVFVRRAQARAASLASAR